MQKGGGAVLPYKRLTGMSRWMGRIFTTGLTIMGCIFSRVTVGAIHSTKISGNFGPKLNGSVRSNRKSFEKTGPPFEVVLFSRSDRSGFWFNGSRPVVAHFHIFGGRKFVTFTVSKRRNVL